MKKILLSYTLVLITLQLSSQPNCEAYKYLGDTLKHKACLKASEAKGLYQFSMKYQSIMDEALKIDPTFDYAYWAKSIAYLKSGDFLSWKTLIDKAVEYNPTEHLGYRGWCRYQFFRDYEGAIMDIERLDSIVDYDIGICQNGMYHLNIAKGLCFKAIGNTDKAIQIIENQIKYNEKNNLIGSFDYLHLGVLYLEKKEYEKALAEFLKQSQVNELAENQYYKAIVFKTMGDIEKYETSLRKAKDLYDSGLYIYDPYSFPADRIFFEDIITEMSKIDNE
jgi:tetratricopeptide (TPR) repeat protein